ncbi:MAG: hypothetical protein FWG70_10835 [Oscillospiraceae bacterium]|nr:hypothetical protein [Oscillospiraceae bacterium]
MNFSYNLLRKYLKRGHEVEFSYSDKEYSFSHNEEGWYITEYNNPDYQTFKTANDLLLNGKINGVSIENIWGDVVIDAIY